MSARTLIVSQRQLWHAPWLSYCVEYESTLAQMLGATTTCISARDTRIARLLRDRYRLRTALSSLPLAQAFHVDRPDEQFDLGIIVVNDLQQLGILSSIPGWRTMADRFVAIVVEVWPAWLDAARPAIEDVLSKMSAGFTTIECSAARLGAMSGVPVQFLPPGTDTLTVTPPFSAERRYVSVSNRGRREITQHRVLNEWSARTDHVYEFDTGTLASVEAHDVHRRHYLEQCARSRVYVTNFARFDQPQISGGVQELGLRYFEGLAMGCVLTGRHPDDDRVRRLLGDEAVVLDFPFGRTDVPADLLDLIDDDESVNRAARDNRALALRRHDILHRWDEVTGVLGLGPTAGMDERRRLLGVAHDALVT